MVIMIGFAFRIFIHCWGKSYDALMIDQKNTQLRLFGHIVRMILGTHSLLCFVMTFSFLGFLHRVTQGLKYLHISSVLFQFLLCFHYRHVKFAISFGFREELGVIIEESA